MDARGHCYVISGLGRGWARGMVVGPGLEACHIVPNYAWDLYPLPEDGDDSDFYSFRRLQKK